MKNFILAFILCLVMAFSLTSCVALQKPGTQLIASVTAQNVAYQVAKGDSELATLCIGITNTALEGLKDTDPNVALQKWGKAVLAKFVADPFLRMNYEKLLSFVTIDLQGKDYSVGQAIVRNVLTDFLIGLRAGR